MQERMKIDPSVPMPERYAGQKKHSIFETMQVGDSFALPIGERRSRWVARSYYAAQTLKMRFAWRTLPDGEVRCWRIK